MTHIRNGRVLLVMFSIQSIMLVSSLSGFSCPGIQGQRRPINWMGIRNAFLAYLDNPSPENGKSFVATLPDKSVCLSNQEERSKTIELIVSSGRNSRLGKRALAGDRYAIEAAFRLLNITDAAYSEMVLILLGDVVRAQPKMFLEVLLSYKDSEQFKADGFPVSMTIYRDDAKYRRELETRIKALDTIKDTKYTEIRDACILQLRKEIRR